MNINQQINFFSDMSFIDECKALFGLIDSLSIDDKITAINELRKCLHEKSPFNSEPVDLVLWVKNTCVIANDYNPNSVAPPEMKLLEHSISEDGYTQPIVTWENGIDREVVDGFHRHRVGKESQIVKSRVHGYLPVVSINSNRQEKNDRMAATIRHNRARGEHKVDSMADIVMELKRRFWSDSKIAVELGMDTDEVLRLQQVTGLAALFSDKEFSEAWEADTFEDTEGKQVLED